MTRTSSTNLFILYSLFNKGDFSAYRGMQRIGFCMEKCKVKLKNQN